MMRKTNKTMNTNRNIILFALLCAFVMLSASAAATDTLTTYITDLARIKISLISQDTDPAEPGGLVEVRWKIENLGSDNAKDVIVKLEPEYPFSLLPGDDGIRDLGSIQGRQLAEEGVIVLYKLRVDEKAIEGDNDISLMFKYDANSWAKTDYFTIRVQTIDAAISIESVKSTPEKMIPGNNAKLDIEIKNLADSYMKDVTLKLDLTFTQYLDYITTLTDASGAYDTLPFAPLNSATEKRIRQIAPGQSKIVSYELMTYSDAEARVYKVPIILTFYDELGEQYVKNDIIGIVVGAEPEMDIVLDSYDVHAPGTAGSISIKFVNKGVTDLKFLNVELLESGDYGITSAAKDYVGNVDSDDYETADFRIYLKDTAQDIVKIPVHVTYKDANNNNYEKEVELELKLLNAKERGVKERSNVGIIVFVFILLIAAYFVYRRWEKKRKKRQGK